MRTGLTFLKAGQNISCSETYTIVRTENLSPNVMHERDQHERQMAIRQRQLEDDAERTNEAPVLRMQ